MPFVLLIIGVWLLVAGVRNTAGPASQPGTLFALVHGDFTGTDNFFYWFAAIVLIGALGYIPKLKPLSTVFLVLLIAVLFLKKGSSTGVGGGFFSQFLSGLGVSNAATSPTNQQNITASGTPIGTTAAQQAGITQSLQQQLQSTF